MPKLRITTLTLHILSVTMKNTHNSCRFPPGVFLLSAAMSGPTPFSSPPLGFNLSQGREGSASFPVRKTGGEGWRMAGSIVAPGGGDGEETRGIYRKHGRAPQHSLTLNEKRPGWGREGFHNDARRRKWTGRILHHSIICTSLFPRVFTFFQMCTCLCMCARSRRCSRGSDILHDGVTPPDSFINASSRLLILKPFSRSSALMRWLSLNVSHRLQNHG